LQRRRLRPRREHGLQGVGAVGLHRKLTIGLLCVLVLAAAAPARRLRVAGAAEPSVVFAALQVLVDRHISRPDPLKLLGAAVTGLRQALESVGVSEKLDDLTAATVTDGRRDFQARFDQATAAAGRRLSEVALQHTAIRAMAASIGTSHNAFFDAEELEAVRREAVNEESYVGIGVRTIVRDDKYYFLEVFPDGPAARAGVRPLDRVVAIDGRSVTGLKPEPFGELLRGHEGTGMRLSLQRAGSPVEIRVVRGRVLIWTVEYSMMEGSIGYIRLTHFVVDATAQVRLALEILRDRGMRAVVVDLRGNPGGFVYELQQIASLILPRGLVIAVREDRQAGRGTLVTSGMPTLAPVMPLVMLIDEDTGSAAEMLAAAVQDHGRGVLVGTRSAGEVLESSLVSLPGGTALLLPVRRVLTARGVDLEGRGVTPDVVVPLAADDLDRGIDAQLQRALRLARPR
jgi:carboxyl-terminal processing protease